MREIFPKSRGIYVTRCRHLRLLYALFGESACIERIMGKYFLFICMFHLWYYLTFSLKFATGNLYNRFSEEFNFSLYGSSVISNLNEIQVGFFSFLKKCVLHKTWILSIKHIIKIYDTSNIFVYGEYLTK
jgi:hypothetical protein